MNSDQRGAVDAVAAAHAGLLESLAGLTDETARQPSLLPDWSVGHVLTHLARNADGFSRMVEGAGRGDVAAMYPAGREGRAADIEAGASRPAAVIVDDLASALARLDGSFAACSDAAWDGAGLTVMGEVKIRELPSRRLGEVEIHRVDLGLGYTFADWPVGFVRTELARLKGIWASRQPMGLTELPAAALHLPPHLRLAWLAGRLVVDGLPPAGVI